MKKRILIAFAVILLAAGIWGAHRLSFDWRALRLQLASASLLHIATGVACIYSGFWARAARWRILMDPATAPSTNALVAPQFIGFAAVALFGRLADLTRPYLIARRAGVAIAAQVAVYSVERIFDLAAAAILFSVTLAFAPRDLPHHQAFVRAGIISLAATLGLGAFALTVRIAGDRIASVVERTIRPLSANFAEAAAARILDFRAGLFTLRSAGEFFAALALSLLLWLGIAFSYVESAHALAHTPELAALTFTQTMLLMATSMGGSLVQLPVLGWFTQIALLAAAIHTFFGAPLEAATACAAIALFVTTLSIIPAGMIAARFTGSSLRTTQSTS